MKTARLALLCALLAAAPSAFAAGGGGSNSHGHDTRIYGEAARDLFAKLCAENGGGEDAGGEVWVWNDHWNCFREDPRAARKDPSDPDLYRCELRSAAP